MSAAMAGTLYGIGVGPGDPELLSLKGYRLLRSVPLVYVPVSGPGGQSYARAIVAEYLTPDIQEIIELPFAMRENEAGMAAQWRKNAERIADGLATGRDAAFLTEGDPLLYSTFVHVAGALATLRPELAVIAVPGVSSIQAAAAAAGMPLADGNERLAIVPATSDPAALRTALIEFDTVVIMKAASAMDRVVELLMELDLAEGAVCISRCGRPDETIVRDVRTLPGQRLDYFSLVIVRRRR